MVEITRFLILELLLFEVASLMREIKGLEILIVFKIFKVRGWLFTAYKGFFYLKKFPSGKLLN